MTSPYAVEVGLKVTKVYEVVEPNRCICRVRSGSEGEGCPNLSTFCVRITTTTVKGRKVVSHVGFCDNHPPIRYFRWFNLNVDSRLSL